MERKHCHILNVAHALRFQANLPIKFWSKYILTRYLINWTPSSLLKRKTPFEMLHGKPPLHSHIMSFGCLAYVHDHNLPKDKFHARITTCVFLGYRPDNKGWRFYDLKMINLYCPRMWYLMSLGSLSVKLIKTLLNVLGILYNLGELVIAHIPRLLPILDYKIKDKYKLVGQLLMDHSAAT